MCTEKNLHPFIRLAKRLAEHLEKYSNQGTKCQVI